MSDLKILVPRAALTRRRFLGVSAGALAGFTLLGACGTDDDTEGSASGSGGGGGGGSRKLHLYTWAEYSDPANLEAFGDVTVDAFDSNEQAIAKLELAKGSSGYDIVVPTGSFVPQMVSKGLLQELDRSKIPNFENLEDAYLDQSWDPGNRYTVLKNIGTTGYVYDTSVITDELEGWAGFFEAAARPEVSGKVSALGAPGDVTGMWFWREGIDWNTTDPAQLDAAEQALLEELVPHLKAFDSYPSTGMLEGSYVLSQAWNGDARIAVVEDPERYRWVLGGPKTEIWADTWAIAAGAKNVDAAHAFIDYMLDPEVSAKELEYHGYPTGVQGVEELLPDDLPGRELIFLSAEEQERLVPGEVNEAQDRVVEIFNNLEAAAGA